MCLYRMYIYRHIHTIIKFIPVLFSFYTNSEAIARAQGYSLVIGEESGHAQKS